MFKLPVWRSTFTDSMGSRSSTTTSAWAIRLGCRCPWRRPRTVRCHDCMTTVRVQVAIHPSTQFPLACLHVAGVGGITGSLDGFTVRSGPGIDPESASVSGWVHDPLLLNAAVISSTVQVELDGRTIVTGVANESRMDLSPEYGGHGRSATCPFGYEIRLPGDAVDILATGNHTLAVYSLRPNGIQRYLVPMAETTSGLACVTPARRQCMGVSCACGAPQPAPPGPPPSPPPRLSISNSVRCLIAGNTCEGEACTTSGPRDCAP